MPELPEVETIIRSLKPGLEGRNITRLDLLHPRVYRDSSSKRLRKVCKGAVINKLQRRGKYILFELSGARPAVVVHLRMTGSLILGNKPEESPHTRAVFHLSDSKVLSFVDIRTFGSIFLLEEPIPSGLQNLGIEPLDPAFSAKKLAEFLQGKKTGIKTVLLRQDLIAGIGNIYASEICYRSGIHPLTPAENIEENQVKSLHRSIRKILKDAIDQMGTTFSDYRRPDGSTGEYGNSLAVYGKHGEPCPKCKSNIERISQNGRSTFFCPKCQN